MPDCEWPIVRAMRIQGTPCRVFAVGICLGWSLGFHAAAQTDDKLSPYLYKDTRRLVSLVEDAADLMEQRGTNIFREFGQENSRWFNDNYYLFVYDVDGNCVFHPANPELVGRNLMGLRDMNGKPVIRWVTDVGRGTNDDASGWVFYLWEEGRELSPMWKSSYVRKVAAPDGKTYVLGCGVYDIKIERAFVKDRVDLAVALVQAKGKDAAFSDFRNSSSPFFFLNAYIFVLDINGRALVDPAYPTLVSRNLQDFQDEVGRYVVREMIQKLESSDEAWVQYMWPKPGDTLPSRKIAYVRKVRVGDETLMVGCDVFMATPIWMKL
jgi:signal transduction histidine kinase